MSERSCSLTCGHRNRTREVAGDKPGGILQVRGDVVKRASLSAMVENAKKEGFFDEEEAKRGIAVREVESTDDTLEMLDEEGNVVAGETVKVEDGNPAGDAFYGPLGGWIGRGMHAKELLDALGLSEWTLPEPVGTATSISAPSANDVIQPMLIQLPERAPKQLLLDLKKIFETFPGRERVELRIGAQTIPVPLTVTRSPILDQKIDEAIQKYSEVEMKS